MTPGKPASRCFVPWSHEFCGIGSDSESPCMIGNVILKAVPWCLIFALKLDYCVNIASMCVF